MIHVNQPLTNAEQEGLRLLDEQVKKDGGKLPRSMEIHRTRVLQQMKGSTKKAAEQLRKNYDFRMKYLPIREADVKVDLDLGWMYWHGRDSRCRPILVIRGSNI